MTNRSYLEVKNLFFFLAAFVIIIAGIKAASQVVILLFLSIFLASILSPVMARLQKLKVPKWTALLVVLAGVSTLLGVLFYLLSVSLQDFVSNFGFYEERLRLLLQEGEEALLRFGIKTEGGIAQGFDPAKLVGLSAKILGGVGLWLSKLVLVLIGVAFLLMESTRFEAKINTVFDDESTKANIRLFSKTIQKYFTIKTATSFLTGALVVTVLTLYEIPYPLLWGVLAFLLNFIPVVGSIIASFPALFLALVHHDGAVFAWLALWYVVINNLISNVIEPKIMGEGLGLSPAVIFFSLIFWGWVLGPAGMFLAVPITMTLKIALDSNASTRWIGVLFSGKIGDEKRT